MIDYKQVATVLAGWSLALAISLALWVVLIYAVVKVVKWAWTA